METGQIRASLSNREELPEFSELSSYVLCLALSQKEIVIGVFDAEKSYAVYFHKYDLESASLTQILSKEIFQQDYSEVRLGIKTPNFVITPRELSSDKLDEELCGSFGMDQSVFRKDALEVLDALVCYELFPAADQVIKQFPNVKISHNAVNFISQGLGRNRFSNGVRVYADLSSSLLELLVVSDNKMVAFSCEDIGGETDAIYYISAHLKNASFDQLEDKLYLSGDISEESAVKTHFSKHVKHTLINSGFSYLRTHKGLAHIHKQHFFSVINSFQCA